MNLHQIWTCPHCKAILAVVDTRKLLFNPRGISHAPCPHFVAAHAFLSWTQHVDDPIDDNATTLQLPVLFGDAVSAHRKKVAAMFSQTEGMPVESESCTPQFKIAEGRWLVIDADVLFTKKLDELVAKLAAS